MKASTPPIVPWRTLASRFQHADLLLGNGFSISVDDRFNYDSLFADFLSTLDETARIRIDSLGSTNFEFLLQSLTRARWVNEKFEIDAEPLHQAIRLIRNGLIQAVERVHPRYHEMDRQ